MLTVREKTYSGRAPTTRAVYLQPVPEGRSAEQPILRRVCIAHRASAHGEGIGVHCTPYTPNAETGMPRQHES